MLLNNEGAPENDKIYVLNHDAFQSNEDLIALSNIYSRNEKASSSDTLIDQNETSDTLEQILIIDIGFESSVFVNDITEIVPWSGNREFQQENGLCSIVVDENYSIPVYPLSQYFNTGDREANTQQEHSTEACVLVSEYSNFRVGFVVNNLVDIKSVSWIKQKAGSPGNKDSKAYSHDDLLLTAKILDYEKSKIISVIEIKQLVRRLFDMENLPALEHLSDSPSTATKFSVS